MLGCSELELVHSNWTELVIREVQDENWQAGNLHQRASGPSLVGKNLPTGMLMIDVWKLPMVVVVKLIT